MVRLNFKIATGDKEYLLSTTLFYKTHRTRLDARQQWGVAVSNTNFTEATGSDNHLYQARENFTLSTDDIALKSHGHSRVSFILSQLTLAVKTSVNSKQARSAPGHSIT